MPEIEERRKFVRLNVLTDVIYVKRPQGREEKLLLTKNIGIGGICLIVYEELQPQDVLDLEIYLPDDKVPIKAVGKVAWVKEFMIGDASRGKRYDAGIEFMEINKKDMDKINKYVFRHSNA